MRTFGGQTVAFISVTEDLTTRDRHNNPGERESASPVGGCRFRPLKASEKINIGTDVVKDPWKCTAPPVPTVVNAQSGDMVEVAGVRYQIVGLPRTFPGMDGLPYKTTIICEAQYG